MRRLITLSGKGARDEKKVRQQPKSRSEKIPDHEMEFIARPLRTLGIARREMDATRIKTRALVKTASIKQAESVTAAVGAVSPVAVASFPSLPVVEAPPAEVRHVEMPHVPAVGNGATSDDKTISHEQAVLILKQAVYEGLDQNPQSFANFGAAIALLTGRDAFQSDFGIGLDVLLAEENGAIRKRFFDDDEKLFRLLDYAKRQALPWPEIRKASIIPGLS